MFQFTRFASLAYVFSQRWPFTNNSQSQLFTLYWASNSEHSYAENYLWRVGFPHSDISGSKLYCQLPEAFRRLTRPSSPVIAKASTTCTYSLDPITLKPLWRFSIYRIYYLFVLFCLSLFRINMQSLPCCQFIQSLHWQHYLLPIF